MIKARIYRPDRTAMQSGKTKDSWLLEFEPQSPLFVENLMGWVSGSDTSQQVRLTFASAEDAIAYAKRQQLDYEVFEPQARHQVTKAYADNFQYNKPNN